MDKSTIKSVAVVLFAYNEEGNLLRLLRRIQSTLIKIDPKLQIQYSLCLQGNQAAVSEVQEFSKEILGTGTLDFSYSVVPRGLKGAAVDAFSLLKKEYDAYLMMDCDLNHQPEELPLFFAQARPGTVVVGSRYCDGGEIQGMPIWKKFLSFCVNRALSMFLAIPCIDKTSGYRLIVGSKATEVVRQVAGKGFDFYIEYLFRLWCAGFQVREVPIVFKVRTVGKSKMTILRTLKDYILLIFRLFRVKRESALQPSPEQIGTF